MSDRFTTLSEGYNLRIFRTSAETKRSHALDDCEIEAYPRAPPASGKEVVQMASLVYVDNSNVWIEGMHVSAVAKGLTLNVWDAQQNRIFDQSWRFDFGRLYEFAGGEVVKHAFLYGSRPPPNDSLWNTAKAKGFEVVVFDRSVSNKEKKIDTKIATDMIAHAYSLANPKEDEFTLVAGDTDYVPVIEHIRGLGFKVDVCFWKHASGELKKAATRFVELDPWLDYLALRKDKK